MWIKKLKPYKSLRTQTIAALYLIGCSRPFVDFGSTDAQADAEIRTPTTIDAGYKAINRSIVIPRKETTTPKSEADSSTTVSEGSVDAGNEPDATIAIQDSGRSETEVKEAATPPPKPWYLTNPDGVCVAGNPKMCLSGCSCPHNGLPWCCT